MYTSFLSHWTGRPESHLVLWEAGNILHPIKGTTSHVEKIHFPSYLPLALTYVLDKKTQHTLLFRALAKALTGSFRLLGEKIGLGKGLVLQKCLSY